MKRWEFMIWCVFACIGAPLIVSSWPARLGTFEAPGLLAKHLDEDDDIPRRYVLYVPREYDGTRPLPLIIFLHGASDAGIDGRLQLKTGLGPEVWMRYQNARPFPYFVLFPQAKSSWLSERADREAVIRMLDNTLKEFAIDVERIYLTGISMGGEGVLKLAAEYTDRWAAVVPISCDGSWVKDVVRIKRLPVRWYQNKHDGIEEVRHAIADLKHAGGTAELIEFEDLTHDAWTRAYSDHGLYIWLDRQVRAAATDLPPSPELSF